MIDKKIKVYTLNNIKLLPDYYQGVYAIRNNVNNKKYIGSTWNIKERIKQHINLLSNNKHHSNKLQIDFNNYKIEDFSLLLIHKVNIQEDLILYEQVYIDAYNTHELGYNVKPYSINDKGSNLNKHISLSNKLKEIIILREKCINYIVNNPLKNVIDHFDIREKKFTGHVYNKLLYLYKYYPTFRRVAYDYINKKYNITDENKLIIQSEVRCYDKEDYHLHFNSSVRLENKRYYNFSIDLKRINAILKNQDDLYNTMSLMTNCDFDEQTKVKSIESNSSCLKYEKIIKEFIN